MRFFLVEPKSCFHAGDFVARRGAIESVALCVWRRHLRNVSTLSHHTRSPEGLGWRGQDGGDGDTSAFMEMEILTLDSSVECLTQRRREAESAENARNLANTMSYASNLLEAKHHLKGETTNCSGHCDKTTNLQFSQHSLPLCASA